jgi:lipopolysaccharide export system protein LptA
MSKIQYYTFLLAFFLASVHANSQDNKEKIKYKAEQLELVKKDGDKVRKLTINVVFTQESTTVYCDSAFFYKNSNIMEAFGHVKIVDDSTTITADKLIYNGDTRISNLRDNVIYRNGENTLYTNFLDYDLDLEIAHYFNKGKLVDETNTLTSQIGYFYSQQDYALFKKNVFLDAPDYDLTTDTLRYNTETKIAYTFGPTTIIKEDSSILNAEKGEFRTKTDQSEFVNGRIETKEYYMEGDDIFFDEANKYYKAIGHVKLTSKEDSIIIIGEEGYYDKIAGLSKVYGRPIMKKPIKSDTLYLSADTLVAVENDIDSLKRVLAYFDVKIFKKGLSGISDSMAYFKSDSMLYFYNDPVMWNDRNQSEADTIAIEMRNEKLDRMYMMSNAFLTSEDTLINYNQIKGRSMTAFFIENKMNKLKVNGNGEMLYYSLEEGDSILMGMNKIFCSHMQIDFRDNKLIRFKVYVNPEANFIPPHELTTEIQRLEGFQWRINEKPELFDVAYYLDSTLNVQKTDSLTLENNHDKTVAAPINPKSKPVKSIDQSVNKEAIRPKPMTTLPLDGSNR